MQSTISIQQNISIEVYLKIIQGFKIYANMSLLDLTFSRVSTKLGDYFGKLFLPSYFQALSL